MCILLTRVIISLSLSLADRRRAPAPNVPREKNPSRFSSAFPGRNERVDGVCGSEMDPLRCRLFMLGLAGCCCFFLCTAFFFVLVNPYIAPSSIYSNNQPTNPPPYVLSARRSSDSTWSATARCRFSAALPGNGREATPCGPSHWPRSSGNAAESGRGRPRALPAPPLVARPSRALPIGPATLMSSLRLHVEWTPGPFSGSPGPLGTPRTPKKITGRPLARVVALCGADGAPKRCDSTDRQAAEGRAGRRAAAAAAAEASGTRCESDVCWIWCSVDRFCIRTPVPGQCVRVCLR